MKTRIAIACAAALAILAGIVAVVSPAQAASGFYVSGGRLYDGNGTDFVMRGVNHPFNWYRGHNGAFADIKSLGANTVRVVLSTGATSTKSTAADVATVISLCKRNRLVCVLEVHDTTGYGDTKAITLSQAADYWISIKSTLAGQEKYVIINIGNEPYGNANTGNWTGATTGAIKKLRNAGLTHTLMVDAPNWGQDWSGVMRNNAKTVFNSDARKNLVFSIHMYGVYNSASKVTSYLNTFVSAKLPIVVGEFGYQHSDGNVDEDTIMATAQSKHLGYMGWSWSGNGSPVQYLDLTNGFNKNSLTWWGKRLFNGANGIKSTSKQASVY
jgi:mannan endo-1,4-beta-mannosidase